MVLQVDNKFTVPIEVVTMGTVEKYVPPISPSEYQLSEMVTLPEGCIVAPSPWYKFAKQDIFFKYKVDASCIYKFVTVTFP